MLFPLELVTGPAGRSVRGNVWHGGLRFNTSKNAVVEAAKAGWRGNKSKNAVVEAAKAGWRGNKSKNAVVEAAKAGLDQASAPAGAEIAGGYMPAWSG